MKVAEGAEGKIKALSFQARKYLKLLSQTQELRVLAFYFQCMRDLCIYARALRARDHWVSTSSGLKESIHAVAIKYCRRLQRNSTTHLQRTVLSAWWKKVVALRAANGLDDTVHSLTNLPNSKNQY